MFGVEAQHSKLCNFVSGSPFSRKLEAFFKEAEKTAIPSFKPIPQGMLNLDAALNSLTHDVESKVEKSWTSTTVSDIFGKLISVSLIRCH
jgi:phage protein D